MRTTTTHNDDGFFSEKFGKNIARTQRRKSALMHGQGSGRLCAKGVSMSVSCINLLEVVLLFICGSGCSLFHGPHIHRGDVACSSRKWSIKRQARPACRAVHEASGAQTACIARLWCFHERKAAPQSLLLLDPRRFRICPTSALQSLEGTFAGAQRCFLSFHAAAPL